MIFASNMSRGFAHCIPVRLTFLDFPFRMLSHTALQDDDYSIMPYSHLLSQVDEECLFTCKRLPTLSLSGDLVTFWFCVLSQFCLLM